MAVDVFSEYPGKPQKKKRRRRGKFPFIKLEGWDVPNVDLPNTRPPKPRYKVGRGQDIRVGKGDRWYDEGDDGGSGEVPAEEQYAPPPDEGSYQDYSPPPPDEPAWQPPIRDIVGDYTPAPREYQPYTPSFQRDELAPGDDENNFTFSYDSGEPGDLPTKYRYADGRIQDPGPQERYTSPSASEIWTPPRYSDINGPRVLEDIPLTNESTYFANDRPIDTFRQAMQLPDTGMQGTYPTERPEDQYPSFENTILRPAVENLLRNAGQSQVQRIIDPLGTKPFQNMEVPETIAGVQIPPDLRAAIQQQMSGEANLGSDLGLYFSAEQAAAHEVGGVLEASIPALGALRMMGIEPAYNTGLTFPGGEEPFVLTPRVATDFVAGTFTPSGILMGHVGGVAASALRGGNIGKMMLTAAGAAAALNPDLAPEIAMAVLPAVVPVVAKMGIKKAGIGFSDEFLPVSSPAALVAQKGQTVLAQVSNARWLPLIGATAGAVGGGTLGANLWAEQQGKPNATLPEQLTAAVAGAALFGGLGWLARREAAVTWHKLNPAATGVVSNDNSIWMPRNSAPVSLQRRQAYIDAQKAEAGMAVGDIPPFYYPGGTTRFLWDKYIRGGWTDDAAYLETFQSAVKNRWGGTPGINIPTSEQGTPAALPISGRDDKALGADYRAYDQQMRNHGVDGAYEHWAQTRMAPVVEKYRLNDSVTNADFVEWSNYFMSHERATGASRMSPEDFGRLTSLSERQTGPFTATVGDTWATLVDFTRAMQDKYKDPVIGVRWTQALKEITQEINWKRREEAGSLESFENIERTIANQPWLLFAKNVETHPAELAGPKRGIPWIAMSQDMRNAADQQALTIMSLQDTMNSVRDMMRRTKQAQMMNYITNLAEDSRVPEQKGLADTFIRVITPPRREREVAQWQKTSRSIEPRLPEVESDYIVTDWGDRGPGPTSRQARERDLPPIAEDAQRRWQETPAPTTQYETTSTGQYAGFRHLSEDMPQPQGPHADTIRNSESLNDIPRDVLGRISIRERDIANAPDEAYRGLVRDKSGQVTPSTAGELRAAVNNIAEPVTKDGAMLEPQSEKQARELIDSLEKRGVDVKEAKAALRSFIQVRHGDYKVEDLEAYRGDKRAAYDEIVDALRKAVQDVPEDPNVKPRLPGEETWRARAIAEHGDPNLDIRDEDVNALRARLGKQPMRQAGEYPIEDTTPPVPEGYVRLYRGQGVPGKDLPEWVQQGIRENGSKEAEGRWWSPDIEDAQWYAKDANNGGHIQYVDVPQEIAERFKASNDPVAARFSKRPNEVFLPSEYAQQGRRWPGTPEGPAALPPGERPAGELPSGQPHDAMQMQKTKADQTLDTDLINRFPQTLPHERKPRFGPNPDGKGGTVWFGDIENDSIPNGWEVVKDFRNGREIAYLVPEDIEQVLHGRSPMWVNTATRIAQVIGAPFRMGSTVLSPGFGIFRNPVKDVQEAGQNLGITWPIMARWPEMWLATLLQPEFQNVQRRGAMYAGAAIGAGVGWNKDSRENASAQERAQAAFTYGALGALATNPQAIRKFINALHPGTNSMQDVQDALPMAGRIAETNPTIAALRTKLGDMWTDPWGRLTRRIAVNQRVMSEAMSQGVRIGTVSETMRPGYTKKAENLLGVRQTTDRSGMSGAEKILSYLHEGIGKVPGALYDPIEMIRSVSEIGELATKGSVYRVLREPPRRGGLGMSREDATLLTRGASVDFSKSGSSMRIMNMFFPLIGAREQGSLRSVKAWNENPAEFTLRAVSQWGLPSAVVQAYWRSDPRLSDLYDKIPEGDKDRNWILPSGATYSDPRTGDEKTIYFKVPKSPIAAFFSMPVEHVIDLLVHTKNNGVALAPNQRTERSAGHKWAQQFVNMLLPYNADERNLADPMESFTGLVQMSPAGAYYTQKYANWDEFMDRPLVPDEQMILPKRYQVGTLPNRGAVQVSERLRAMGMPEWLTPSPVDVQLAAKTFGGTLATQFLGALDQVIDGTGIMPDVPTWAQRLDKPEGISDESWRQYIDSLTPNQNNARIPRWAEATHSIMTGFAGGQQTIAAKIKEMSPQERTQWEHTQALFGKAADWKTNVYLPEVQRITNDPTLTPAQRARQLDELNAKRRASYDVLKGVYTQAIINPQEREQFKSRLPGVPVTIDHLRQFQDLPDTLDPVAIEDAWYRPGGMTPDQMAALLPAQLQRVRQTELTNLARAHEANPQTLKDYINALESNREMKVIGVSANWLDDAVNRFQRPGVDPKNPTARLPYQVDEKDQYGNPTGQVYDDPLLLRAARDAEMQKMSSEYGVDTDTLKNRINLRISGEMVSPVQHSRRRAQDLFAELHDPLKHPEFLVEKRRDDGTVVRLPLAENTQQTLIFENELAVIAKIPPNQRTPEQNLIYDAKKRGDLDKYQALVNDPRGIDYDLWYGVGKSMTPSEWKRYQTEPRYKDAAASDNRLNDMVMKLYLLTPAKERPDDLKQAYKELQKRKLPNFKNTDLINPLTGELTELGEQLEQIRVGGGQDIRTDAMADANAGPPDQSPYPSAVGMGSDDDGDGYDDDTGEPVDQTPQDQPTEDMTFVPMEDWTFQDQQPADVTPPDYTPPETDLTPPDVQPQDDVTDYNANPPGATDVTAAQPLDIPTDNARPTQQNTRDWVDDLNNTNQKPDPEDWGTWDNYYDENGVRIFVDPTTGEEFTEEQLQNGGTADDEIWDEYKGLKWNSPDYLVELRQRLGIADEDRPADVLNSQNAAMARGEIPYPPPTFAAIPGTSSQVRNDSQTWSPAFIQKVAQRGYMPELEDIYRQAWDEVKKALQGAKVSYGPNVEQLRHMVFAGFDPDPGEYAHYNPNFSENQSYADVYLNPWTIDNATGALMAEGQRRAPASFMATGDPASNAGHILNVIVHEMTHSTQNKDRDYYPTGSDLHDPRFSRALMTLMDSLDQNGVVDRLAARLDSFRQRHGDEFMADTKRIAWYPIAELGYRMRNNPQNIPVVEFGQ